MNIQSHLIKIVNNAKKLPENKLSEEGFFAREWILAFQPIIESFRDEESEEDFNSDFGDILEFLNDITSLESDVTNKIDRKEENQFPQLPRDVNIWRFQEFENLRASWAKRRFKDWYAEWLRNCIINLGDSFLISNAYIWELGFYLDNILQGYLDVQTESIEDFI